MTDVAQYITSGKAIVGIEFGSTRIKAVMIGPGFTPVAMGIHDWENRLEDGYWTYSLAEIEDGLRDAYAKMAADAKARHGVEVTRLAALGVSGMMHGYMPFDADWRLLTPFRTWRNTTTAEAATELSALFGFNIPQRWSVAHYRQALINKEKHVSSVRHLTTLAGFVHHRLCGENALGVGEASGMFPIDPQTGDYDAKMLKAFDALAAGDPAHRAPLKELLPKALPAGAAAGRLTTEGAAWLDPTGRLAPGALMAPPEGDAGTGMVATNAVRARTGNVSAGTSIFAMVVLEKAMAGFYPEIDVVATPSGKAVAMVHCNNCTNEINAWVQGVLGGDYAGLFRESLKGDADCGGVVVVPFLSAEPVAGADAAMLRVERRPDANLSLANFMRAQIYSAFVSLKFGMDVLARREAVEIDSLTAHGGIFATPGVAQQYLADALGTPVTCLATASEGGPWGMAVLAAFALDSQDEGAPLEDYLAERVFAGARTETLAPTAAGAAGFAAYAAMLEKLKEKVFAANQRLVSSGLVVLTWGNASGFDPATGLVAIKPSGVDYAAMKTSDMVVVDLEGRVVEGTLRPSSDTPTHLEIYRRFAGVRGVVHTHSVEATAWAQALREIPAYGTTHADTFNGPVPLTRILYRQEVDEAYELNTGKVIVERFNGIDPLAAPGVLVAGHAPFTWGKDPADAVDHAIALEAIARMARLTEQIAVARPAAPLVPYVGEKHYLRKHGKNAYYGQNA